MQRKKEKYFTTGEFAAYFGIRKDTLFYYDRIGLFQPEGVGDNGYRYYSDAQITPFSALLSLREMGVPIRELQSYFGNPSPERLLALASDKIRKMDEEIRRLQETRRLFSEIAEHTGEARDAAIGQTEFLRMPERRFIYSEKLDLNMENATGEQWGDAYARFARQAGTVGAVSIGCVLARENLEAGKYEIVDRLFMPGDGSRGETRPAGLYAVLYYQGPYREMAGAYRQLLREIRQKGMVLDGDSHEEYLVEALAARKEEDYITKISIKVRERKKDL